MLRLIVVTLCVSAATCGDSKCANGDFQCELVEFLDELDREPAVDVLGLTLVRKSGHFRARTDPGLIERFVQFVESHEVKIAPSITDRNWENEARTKKLKKILFPILMFLKLKAAIVIPAVLALMGALAVKGFGMSLVALTVAVGVALKNFVAEEHYHHGPKVAYEIVPQVWQRNAMEQGAPLAYQPIS
ncbi:uncharacterized protein Osi15 [Tribolium castaneum]|uniref:Uncharacterized protein n=1 Tax=Tribolium castaneum TaxID=7070 RepID=D6WZJ1_TRICA|nr:hypothetical protein TcasGA2_TC011828 [Tribolium castaneum]